MLLGAYCLPHAPLSAPWLSTYEPAVAGSGLGLVLPGREDRKGHDWESLAGEHGNLFARATVFSPSLNSSGGPKK